MKLKAIINVINKKGEYSPQSRASSVQFALCALASAAELHASDSQFLFLSYLLHYVFFCFLFKASMHFCVIT